MFSKVYLSREETPNSTATLNLPDNTSAHQNIEAHGQEKNNMELVTIKNTDNMSTSISEESDQDLDEVTSVDSLSLQDVTSGMSETADSIPMGTQFGLTHLNKSHGNHIGPKYTASHITVVNPVEIIPVDRKRKCLHIVSAITFIAIILVFLLIVLLNKWNIEVNPNETSIMNNNRSANFNILHTPEFVSRDAWGANPLDLTYPYSQEFQFLIFLITITQTNTNSCNSLESCSKIMREIQERDINIVDEIDISYNFLIGGDGNIYEGRGWVSDYNLIHIQIGSIRVGFIGDYSIVGRGDVLSEQQKTAFDVFIKKGISDRHIRRDYQALPECCHTIGGSFVGYNLFIIYFNASTQIHCPDDIFFREKYKLCESKNTIN